MNVTECSGAGLRPCADDQTDLKHCWLCWRLLKPIFSLTTSPACPPACPPAQRPLKVIGCKSDGPVNLSLSKCPHPAHQPIHMLCRVPARAWTCRV